MAPSLPHSLSSGPVRLSQDMATLVNNRQGSDVMFKVGGGDPTAFHQNSKNYDESTAMVIYAHSIILRCRSRYFASMFDSERQWKESTNNLIYKPNISSSTFLDVLYYIYAGIVRTETPEITIELIAAAEEMDLEELSIECQTRLIDMAKLALSEEGDGDHEKKMRKIFKEFTDGCLPIDIIIRRLIIPALNLANSHSLSYLLQQLLNVILPRMTVIIRSPDANTAFFNEISSQVLMQIIGSDRLSMIERDIWDLVLIWACHQINVTKTAIDASLRIKGDTEDNEEDNELGSLDTIENNDDDYKQNNDDNTFISAAQLKQLKSILEPLLPAIRFSLLEVKDYTNMVNMLDYFLPRRQFLELKQFFTNADHVELQLDVPRVENIDIIEKIPSIIVKEFMTWRLLKRHIFETGGINGCPSSEHLKFELLFRASDDGFLANTFHERCDDEGPTITIIRSTNGHLFGGVNFLPWKPNGGYFSNNSNFLFALADGYHRKDSVIFRMKDQRSAEYSICNSWGKGPTFGSGYDLYISDSANTNQSSYSNLPHSYNGNGASNTSLAGAKNFTVSDYEVFAISKK